MRRQRGCRRLLRRPAKAAPAGVGTAGDQVTWRAGAVPGMRVVHRRTGPPYPRETRTETWLLRLTHGRQQREIMIESNQGRALTSAATVGMRVRQDGGHTELPSGVSPEDRADLDRLAYEPAPGVWALAEVHGELADVRTLLTGLRQLPADDPRLDTYAGKD
ncbi:hypothetical protein ACWKSP_14575 [Micromonosporaceae bacterium Da 78-11]